MVKAIWNDVVIAESDETVRVEGNHYFPPQAVNRDLLRDSAKTTVCGWKGVASYYTLTVAGQTNEDAAWYYAEPKERAANIRGYVAFWRGVKVVEA